MDEQQLAAISRQRANTPYDQKIVTAAIFYCVGEQFHHNFNWVDESFERAYKYNSSDPTFAAVTFRFWSSQENTRGLLDQYLQKKDITFQNNCKRQMLEHLVDVDAPLEYPLLYALPALPCISGREAFTVWRDVNKSKEHAFGWVVENIVECLNSDTEYYANRMYVCQNILLHISQFSRTLSTTVCQQVDEMFEVINTRCAKQNLLQNIDPSNAVPIVRKT